MIEFCTKKRMLIACGLLVSISVIVLIVENNLPLSRSAMDDLPDPTDSSLEQPCWKDETAEVVKDCKPCTTLEKKIHDYCSRTGYKEKVKCSLRNGTEKYEYKSCPKLSYIEERRFWTFEGTMLLVGLLSYGVVHSRQTKLNRDLMERVHKQIAAGV